MKRKRLRHGWCDENKPVIHWSCIRLEHNRLHRLPHVNPQTCYHSNHYYTWVSQFAYRRLHVERTSALLYRSWAYRPFWEPLKVDSNSSSRVAAWRGDSAAVTMPSKRAIASRVVASICPMNCLSHGNRLQYARENFCLPPPKRPHIIIINGSVRSFFLQFQKPCLPSMWLCSTSILLFCATSATVSILEGKTRRRQSQTSLFFLNKHNKVHYY